MIPKKVVTQEEIEREEALQVARIEYQRSLKLHNDMARLRDASNLISPTPPVTAVVSAASRLHSNIVSEDQEDASKAVKPRRAPGVDLYGPKPPPKTVTVVPAQGTLPVVLEPFLLSTPVTL